MYYYALVSDKGIVIDVIQEESELTPDKNIIAISTYDTTIIGKYYDIDNSTTDSPVFTDVPNWVNDYEYHTGRLGKKGYTSGSLNDYLDEQQSLNAVGTYEGNGTTSRTITLSFTPKAVIVFRNDGVQSDTSNIYHAVAVTSSPVVVSGGNALEIVENGFTVGRVTGSGLNTSTKVYNYIAIG